MSYTARSRCPISLALERFGDRWSLLVIRDILFDDRRGYGELLLGSEERIATSVLADRLKHLVRGGLLTRRRDPDHRQKSRYCLTEAGIQLLPLLAQLGAWGRRHTAANVEHSVRAELLERGGPKAWEAQMQELRRMHLGSQPKPLRLGR